MIGIGDIAQLADLPLNIIVIGVLVWLLWKRDRLIERIILGDDETDQEA